MTTHPTYFAVKPDGTTIDVPPTFDGIKAGLDGATFDVVQFAPDATLFVDGEGLLNGAALNVPASMMTGMALFGPVVLTGGTDDEGATMLPPSKAVKALTSLATIWQSVGTHAAATGQSVTVTANADTIPSPTVVGMTEDQLDAWLKGNLSVDDLVAAENDAKVAKLLGLDAQ